MMILFYAFSCKTFGGNRTRRNRIDLIVMQILNLHQANERTNEWSNTGMNSNEKCKVIRSNHSSGVGNAQCKMSPLLPFLLCFCRWALHLHLDTHLIYDSVTYEICIGIGTTTTTMHIVYAVHFILCGVQHFPHTHPGYFALSRLFVVFNVWMCHVERMWEYSDSYKSVAFQKCEHFRRQNVICQFEISGWKLTDQSMNGFFDGIEDKEKTRENSLSFCVCVCWTWIFETKRMWFLTVKDREREGRRELHGNQCKCKCHRQQNERLNLQIVCYRNDRHFEFIFRVCASVPFNL